MQRLASYLIAVTLIAGTKPALAQVPAPQDVFGWAPCADYEVADYEQMQAYFHQLAAATDRVQLIEIGRTAMGRPMMLMFISSEESMRQLDRWRSAMGIPSRSSSWLAPMPNLHISHGVCQSLKTVILHSTVSPSSMGTAPGVPVDMNIAGQKRHYL
jgi:hypothetical protein